jgi:hypothetical protein
MFNRNFECLWTFSSQNTNMCVWVEMDRKSFVRPERVCEKFLEFLNISKNLKV